MCNKTSRYYNTVISHYIRTMRTALFFFFMTGSGFDSARYVYRESPISSRRHTNGGNHAPVDNQLSSSIKFEKNAKYQTLNKGAFPL